MKRSLKHILSVVLRGWVGSFFVAVLLTTSLRSALADWYVVPTESMLPTILIGDRIFTNKLAYDLKIPYTTLRLAHWDDPKRGDIVVFSSPADGTRLVKRVVGIPGDIVAMNDNHLRINGVTVSLQASANEATMIENLAGREHRCLLTPQFPAMRSFAPLTIPDGHYFMMGDNRDNSADSRYFGLVDRKAIEGRATAVVISLDLQHHSKPRWDRFFTELL